MRTDFFRRGALALVGIFSALAVFSGIFYARVLLNMQILELTRTFYFLVSDDESVAVSAQSVYLSGGAGYLMSRDGQEYAVLACYFTSTEARIVRDNLASRRIAASVLEESGGRLYLKSNSEKRNAERLAGCFNTLSDCIRLLYDLSVKAEKGEYTQQKLKFVLRETGGVLSCLAKENDGGLFAKLSVCAAKASEKLSEIYRSTVYAKDIRYVQVYLSDSYLSLASDFSL